MDNYKRMTMVFVQMHTSTVVVYRADGKPMKIDITVSIEVQLLLQT